MVVNKTIFASRGKYKQGTIQARENTGLASRNKGLTRKNLCKQKGVDAYYLQALGIAQEQSRNCHRQKENGPDRKDSLQTARGHSEPVLECCLNGALKHQDCDDTCKVKLKAQPWRMQPAIAGQQMQSRGVRILKTNHGKLSFASSLAAVQESFERPPFMSISTEPFGKAIPIVINS